MTHLCSPCGQEFATEAEYVNHECEKAEGAKPTEVEFLTRTTTKHFAKISESAQKRGLDKEKKVKKTK